jgi:HSP20 family molecular chaperone IbpA
VIVSSWSLLSFAGKISAAGKAHSRATRPRTSGEVSAKFRACADEWRSAKIVHWIRSREPTIRHINDTWEAYMALIKSRRVLPRAPIGFPAFSPVHTLDDVESRMRKMFENVLTPFEGDFVAQPIGFLPATDIFETDDLLILTAELPGLEKKDVEISVDEGVLTLRGEKFEEKKEEDKKFHLYERAFGTFQRSFALPRGVDPAKITAEFDKGILKVLLPKTAEAKAKSRKVEIATK